MEYGNSGVDYSRLAKLLMQNDDHWFYLNCIGNIVYALESFHHRLFIKDRRITHKVGAMTAETVFWEQNASKVKPIAGEVHFRFAYMCEKCEHVREKRGEVNKRERETRNIHTHG